MNRISHPIGTVVQVTDACLNAIATNHPDVDLSDEAVITGVHFGTDGMLCYEINAETLVFTVDDFETLELPSPDSLIEAFEHVQKHADTSMGGNVISVFDAKDYQDCRHGHLPGCEDEDCEGECTETDDLDG